MDFRQQKRCEGRPVLSGAVPLQQDCWVTCPYCGEAFVLVVDGSAGNQRYFEDCEVCCRPILFHIVIGGDGSVESVISRREDD